MERVKTLEIHINATAVWATPDHTVRRKLTNANLSHAKMVAHAKTWLDPINASVGVDSKGKIVN